MSRSSHIPVHIHACVRAAVVAALVAPLAACSSSAPSGGPAARATPSPDDRPVTVSVTPTGQRIPAGEPVRVTVSGGRLTSVTVTDAEGHRLAGKAAADGRSWVSDRKAVPGTAYEVTAATRSAGGTARSARAGFTTAPADKVNKVDWRPGTGTTVGVAQPVSLVFDHPVKNRAEVEKQLKVTTSNDTEG
ncbi:Ig-like domain-containing protein, partial [Streptomyces globisporus]